MATNYATPRFHVNSVNCFTRHFGNTRQNALYFFIGDHVPHTNNVIQNVNTDIRDTFINPYLTMIEGKRLFTENFVPVIQNYSYVANTVYSMYDDQDSNLFHEQFYTIVNQGTFYHVFKCLDNNNGAASTIQPDFTQIVGSNTVLYQTSDGYQWKYMYTVDSTTVNNAATPTYFPLVPNTVVAAAAVPGTIDVCKVTFGGKLYNNWILGSFATSDIAIGGDPTTFNCSNNLVNISNGYYNDCIMYLTSGPAIGQYAVIQSSFSNTTGSYFKLANSFSTTPTNGTTYQVYPQCHIQGTGIETQEVVAMALVNAIASNSVYSIQILQRGVGFSNTLNAFVSANASVGVSANAIIRPILPPPGGHGADASAELDATSVMVWVQLDGTESNTIIANNDYQQIGLLLNPTFSNAHVTLNYTTGTFKVGEIAYLVNPVQVQPLCNVQVGNNFVSSNTASFTSQFSANSPILLVSNTGTVSQLAVVNNVVNTSFLFLTTNANFSCTNVIVYNPNIYGNVTVTAVNSLSDIYIANAPGTMDSNSWLLGTVSSTFATISQIQRNDVTKDFNTFIQLNKYSVTIVSGSFVPNEIVMQGNSAGFFHSGNTGTIYLSGVNGVINLSGQNLVGQVSGAVAQITKIYPQELVFGTGEILYVENISSITRQPDQQEAFKLALNY